MTELLERALEAVRRQPPEVQDRVAEAMLTVLDGPSDETMDFQTEELRAMCQEGLDSGPGRFANIEEIKHEARRRWENARVTGG